MVEPVDKPVSIAYMNAEALFIRWMSIKARFSVDFTLMMSVNAAVAPRQYSGGGCQVLSGYAP
jgi:hypothetical protein